jgi:hypothetical protein
MRHTPDTTHTGPTGVGGAVRPESRHGSARVQRRPRWSTAVAIAGIAALAGGGAAIAIRQPFTPSAPTSMAGGDVPGSAALGSPQPGSGELIAPQPGTSTPASAPSPSSTDTAVAADPTIAPTNTERAVAPPVAAAAASPGRPPAAVGSGPCRPTRFVMSDLGIDTAVVNLSVTPDGDLGTPSDSQRTSAGWFPSVLAGADHGTVLMDGHTYHDGSAIFKPSFKQTVRPGMVMRLACADGHAFSYRVAEVVVDLSPASYPRFVTSRDLYAADGPAQLVMVTCTDYLPAQRVWANRAVVIATPMA